MILRGYPTRIFTTLKSVNEALTRELPEILLLDLIFGRRGILRSCVLISDIEAAYPLG
jgi:hypothetical protein